MSVEITWDRGVAEITLNRPEKRNAMTDAMWGRLDEILAGFAGAPPRVLVIAGAGGAFCGGSDVGGLLDDLGSLPERIAVSDRCVLAMRDLPFPTIAKVGGVAAGSGANLALACDFVVAAESASFAQLFIRRALSVDSGASWLMTRLVGERKARELCLLGDAVGARAALAMNMINSVVPDDGLDEAVAALATRLHGLSPAALAGTKRMLGEAWEHDLAEALDAEAANQVRVIAGDEARAAISGFGTRSRPFFTRRLQEEP